MQRILFLLAIIATVTCGSQLDVTTHYKYETRVLADEECSPLNGTGHGVRATVQLTTVWQKPPRQLVAIKVSEPELLVSKRSAFVEVESDLGKSPSPESFFLLTDGMVEKFWDHPSEHPVLRNLKRSVASWLQVRRTDGEVKANDVSGECAVLYKTEGNTVRRNLGHCRHPIQDSVLSQPLGARSSSVHRSTAIDCELQDGDVVSQCVTAERVQTFSNLWKKSSICIQSTSIFQLESISENGQVFKNEDYTQVIEEMKKSGDLVEGSLFSVAEVREETISVTVADAMKSFLEGLKSTHLAKLKSASAFFKLLPVFRAASKGDILKVLENKKFAPVLPQLLDVVAATCTQPSLEAAFSYFGQLKDYDPNLERFLISLTAAPRPQTAHLKHIKAFLEKGKHHEKIEATLIATLGAVLRSYAQNVAKADPKVIGEVLECMESALKKCTSDSCIQSWLRGIRNAAQPSSVPLLLQQAMKGGKPSLEALLAVRRLSASKLSRQSQEVLRQIFHQVGATQDRSSRAVAAEILLSGGADDDILKSVLGSLSDQSDPELASFVVSKLFHLMGEQKVLRSRILRLLPEKEISHYYSLSQKGKSSLFKRQLMAIHGLNVSYGIEMELLEGGLLKRSTFDVELETESEIANLLSVGIFAEGMESFSGDASSDEGGDPTAGMQLTLLGASLRPYVFFSSTSELMGHAWSGTASEPTPALQGIYSLCDEVRSLVLHNGMVARLELRGALSVDLSASVQISLWNRNSRSMVRNAAALLVRGVAVVDSLSAATRGESLFYGHSAIDFTTDLEFAEAPFKMCLQMEHPEVVLRHDFQRSVEASESKFSLKKTKRRKRFIPGRSYALHPNNNELCRIMTKESDGY